MLEEFIRESRMVVLGFYVNDPKVKQRANDIIENRAATTASETGGNMHAVRAKIIDSYLEMGTRYFKRYASMNWPIFLTPQSQTRLENIKAEIAVIDEVIYQIQQEARTSDRASMAELGQYLFSKVRLERVVENVETEMLNMIDSHLFKERLLPDVVRHFYEASKKRP